MVMIACVYRCGFLEHEVCMKYKQETHIYSNFCYVLLFYEEAFFFCN